MNSKFYNALNEFMEKEDVKTEEEYEKKLQEFMQKYNAGEIEYTKTPLDEAYEILEKAENSKSEKQALKYAKQAYEKCPECFDAIIFQVTLEEEPTKKLALLEKGLEIEKERLKKEGFFDKESIGKFYGLFEARPYMRGLDVKANLLIVEGKMRQAIDVCHEMMRLNNNDNMGARYMLMALYAFLEDEKELLKLYKKYPEEHLEVLFPMFVLYYKQGNDAKAKEYLDRINKANPHFIKLFKGTIKENKDMPLGYHSKGDSSEVLMYFMNYTFLIATMNTIDSYILKNSKKSK